MAKKKICFLTIRNIFAITCLPRYTKAFGDTPFDIIYWDRNGVEENCGAENHYAMKYPVTNSTSKWKKLYGYIKFMRYAKKILNSTDYDKIVVLPTQTGILFNNLLKRKYKGKYIFDIRDYTAENNKIFYNIVKGLINNSGLTIITSPAYKSFLPNYDYIISHNITNIPETKIKNHRNRKKDTESRIVISCIGGIRFYEQFKRVLINFKNDNRYLLRFIGTGSEGLSEFVKENKIENVELIGRFSPDKTLDFYIDTDIVMNLYGNNSPLLDYALSNKLYYAASLGMPILVSPNTYMEEVTINNGFGFSFDLEDKNMRDKLYEYYNSIDWPVFYKNCDKFMKEVFKDEETFHDTVSKFIKQDN